MVDIIKTLKILIPIKNEKYGSFLMIGVTICLVIKKTNPVVTDLFIRGSKLNICFVFITNFSYFAVPRDIRLNSMHYFIIKIPNKQELKQNPSHNSSDIDFNDFISLCKKCASEP